MCDLVKEANSKKIKNKFELVLIAAKRAREISLNNIKTQINNTNDKTTITALKEIEKGYKENIDLNENIKIKI
ncbi:MAG TPA: DNA-directed RNA polymerase subunit omega [Candidatus Azoamicus sp.]